MYVALKYMFRQSICIWGKFGEVYPVHILPCTYFFFKWPTLHLIVFSPAHNEFSDNVPHLCMSHHLYLTLQSSIPHSGGKNDYVWISKPIHL